MTSTSSIAEHLERQSVVSMESTIPTEMTVGEWRRRRSARARAARRGSRVFAPARRVMPLRPVPCDHLHDTTTRYDPVEKLLTFLLICPVCSTEKVLETQHYEPRFQSQPANAPAGARMHHLPVRLGISHPFGPKRSGIHPASGMTIASESR